MKAPALNDDIIVIVSRSLASLRLKSYAHSITICSQRYYAIDPSTATFIILSLYSIFVISLLTEMIDHASKQVCVLINQV